MARGNNFNILPSTIRQCFHVFFFDIFFLQHVMQRKIIKIGDSREEKGRMEEMNHPSGNISMNMVFLKGLDGTQKSMMNVISSGRK